MKTLVIPTQSKHCESGWALQTPWLVEVGMRLSYLFPFVRLSSLEVSLFAGL